MRLQKNCRHSYAAAHKVCRHRLFFPRPALWLCFFFVRSGRVEFSESGKCLVCPSADFAVWGFFQPGVNNRPYPLQFLPVVLFQGESRPARHLIQILIDARAEFLKARLLPIICKPFRFYHFIILPISCPRNVRHVRARAQP